MTASDRSADAHTHQKAIKVTIANTFPRRGKAPDITGPRKFVLNNNHMEGWAKGRAEGVAAGYKQGWDAAREAWLMDSDKGWDNGYRDGRHEGYEKGLDDAREEHEQQQQHQWRTGMADALCFILMSRFGELSKDMADRIYIALDDELYAWIATALDARTLEDVFASTMDPVVRACYGDPDSDNTRPQMP